MDRDALFTEIEAADVLNISVISLFGRSRHGGLGSTDQPSCELVGPYVTVVATF
jgi:hypothetical protein